MPFRMRLPTSWWRPGWFLTACLAAGVASVRDDALTVGRQMRRRMV